MNSIFIRVLVYVFLGTVLFSCSNSDDTFLEPEPTEPTTPTAAINDTLIRDIAFGTHPLQTYDLYLPENRSAENTKVIVLVHGGGWQSGDKSSMDPFRELIQKNHPELAVMNVNYVLADEDTPAFPNQFNDIVAAMSHLEENAEQFQIQSSYGMIGTSAGGQLAMLYGFDSQYASKVDMICTIVGPADFTDPSYTDNAELAAPTFRLLLGPDVPMSEEVLRRYSPIFKIDNMAPPTILFYGKSDPLVPVTQAERLKAALDANSIENELSLYEGGHADWQPQNFIDVNVKMNAFIRKHMQ